MDEQIDLPELPQRLAGALASYKRGMYSYDSVVKEVEAFARAAVLKERERLLAVVNGQTHPIAEFLYGHPRHKAVEWAKEDKYDSDASKAGEILAIVAAAIRKG